MSDEVNECHVRFTQSETVFRYTFLTGNWVTVLIKRIRRYIVRKFNIGRNRSPFVGL
jgi:hypothetical protein